MILFFVLFSRVVSSAELRTNMRPTAAECAGHLDSTEVSETGDQEKAAAVARWFALEDPAFARAAAAAPHRDRLALLSLPLGFAILPPGDTLFDDRTALKAFKRVTWFHPLGSSGVFWSNQAAIKRLRRTRQFVTNEWGGSSDRTRKIELVAQIMSNASALLEALPASIVPEASPQPEYPKLLVDVSVPLINGVFQCIRLNWTRSFSRNDLEHLRELYTYLERPTVRRLVALILFDNLPAIVERLQILTFEITFRMDSSTVETLISGFEPAAFLETPSAADVIAAPPALTSAAVSAPSIEVALVDAAAVEALVTAPRSAAKVLDAVDLGRTWQDLQRVGGLVNEVLLVLQKLPAVTRDWSAWADHPKASLAPELNAYLTKISASSALEPLRLAEHSLTRLRDYVDAERERFLAFDLSEVEIQRLKPHARDVLSATLAYVETLTLLTQQTLAAVSHRQEVALGLSEEVALVRTQLAHVLQAELRGNAREARATLRQALKDLGENSN